jgi:hypothetical protein
MRIKLIRPIAGVVAEFSSAYEMMDHFMRIGRGELTEDVDLKELMFQVSEGGLIFQEVVDSPPAAAALARDGLLCMHSRFQLQ